MILVIVMTALLVLATLGILVLIYKFNAVISCIACFLLSTASIAPFVYRHYAKILEPGYGPDNASEIVGSGVTLLLCGGILSSCIVFLGLVIFKSCKGAKNITSTCS